MMRNLCTFLSGLRNRHLLLLDLVVLGVTPALALALRLDGFESIGPYAHGLAVFTVLVTLVKISVFHATGLYRCCWAYASSDELLMLLESVGLAVAAAWLLAVAFLYPHGVVPPGFPRSLPILDGVLTAVGIGGVRLCIRLLYGVLVARGSRRDDCRRVLVAGAGTAGSLIVKELQTNARLGFQPAGFLDDDTRKHGMMIHGVRVLGPLQELPEQARRTGSSLAIVAMPSAPGRIVRELIGHCRDAGIEVKTVPGLFEILRGSARIEELRSIRLEDLLGRRTVPTNSAAAAEILEGARVLVTGAGGSIGAELCRQIHALRPGEMTLLGHGENSIFAIARELQALTDGGRTVCRPVIADIRDRARMAWVFGHHRPQIVFHAAAHKHVGLMQQNVMDAVTNNVLGTRTLLDLAVRSDTGRFIMVSSDKAVNPTCVMGVTKRVAELLVRDAGVRGSCACMTVRFGNVLGSRGSVVPIFQQQIARGGPVTVSDPEAKRFFMTIPEAVHLVLQAAAIGRGGELFILDMGEQVRVLDIARDVIRLHRLEPGKDVDIVFTGLLPGEKMREEILYAGERSEPTSHDRVLVCRTGPGTGTGASAGLGQVTQENPLRLDVDTLIEAARQGSFDLVRNLLHRIVPEFSPPAGMAWQQEDRPRRPSAEGTEEMPPHDSIIHTHH